MRVHGSYDVSSPEAGTVSKTDKNSVPPYKHWIFRLISFFILCGVVLALCFLSLRTTKPAENGIGRKSQAFKVGYTYAFEY